MVNDFPGRRAELVQAPEFRPDGANAEYFDAVYSFVQLHLYRVKGPAEPHVEVSGTRLAQLRAKSLRFVYS
ncbi:uncharacterized protein MCYG_04380 [Microsporum canis CBS 113480]|uniref:Uncharacterized protein n=1 Tax=Arthroderma otae (strain ATCC MYA-4605 / CBS 113480) TaxID=554155 RepID=C5FNE7_ARTOC|nr:uncharacterized protein MCYG_04380 [Microsporum canis CBS 113480]EEQ31561.1 hypothetical protein MCYG_04380 [Microsporum canis CBS 113480]